MTDGCSGAVGNRTVWAPKDGSQGCASAGHGSSPQLTCCSGNLGSRSPSLLGGLAPFLQFPPGPYLPKHTAGASHSAPAHLRVTSRSREPGSEPPELFVAPREQSLSEDLTAGLSEATAQALRLTLGPPERAGRPALWSGLFPCSHPAAPH